MRKHPKNSVVYGDRSLIPALVVNGPFTTKHISIPPFGPRPIETRMLLMPHARQYVFLSHSVYMTDQSSCPLILDPPHVVRNGRIFLENGRL